jgi:hypothetical protein
MTNVGESHSLFEIDNELDDLIEQIEEQAAVEGEASEELLCRVASASSVRFTERK